MYTQEDVDLTMSTASCCETEKERRLEERCNKLVAEIQRLDSKCRDYEVRLSKALSNHRRGWWW